MASCLKQSVGPLSHQAVQPSACPRSSRSVVFALTSGNIQANSASYPQRDGKRVPAKVRRRSAAGVKGRYGLWINVRVAGKTA